MKSFSGMLTKKFMHSDIVHQIFEPLITAIVQLVAEQVANVRIKRMGANHPKGKEIKVL